MQVDSINQSKGLKMRFCPFGLAPQADKLRWLSSHQQSLTFFQQEAIEQTDRKNLSMPVVQSDTLCLGDLALRETFHASTIRVTKSVLSQSQDIAIHNQHTQPQDKTTTHPFLPRSISL